MSCRLANRSRASKADQRSEVDGPPGGERDVGTDPGKDGENAVDVTGPASERVVDIAVPEQRLQQAIVGTAMATSGGALDRQLPSLPPQRLQDKPLSGFPRSFPVAGLAHMRALHHLQFQAPTLAVEGDAVRLP